ncbi:hypothetical protein RND81_13G143200 [Saponaria officinalis]|uniref:Bifunctional inhibitor/plant lipid transfer protein/seed storage helical domain-containing protein n=1 Tax=Saponaria officinalis TaxID=3572 RepID=A0AAW1GZT9_SAPOF
MSSSSKKSQLCIVLLILTISLKCDVVKCQSSCTSVLISMSSCLNYITGNSKTPAASCCSALANVVQSQPQCLCSALSSGAASSLGVAINQTRALELPKSCDVQTPPVSKCNGGGGGSTTAAGAAAPADSPTGVPDEQSDAPSDNFPSGAGSKTVPGSASDGSIVKSSISVLAFVVSSASILAVF